MNDPREQRRYTRAHLKSKIDWVKDLAEYSGYTENISEGGVFIATPVTLPEGELLELHLELDGGTEVVTRARVAWLRPATEEELPGMGLQFVNPPPELVQHIREYVEAADTEMLLFRAEE